MYLLDWKTFSEITYNVCITYVAAAVMRCCPIQVFDQLHLTAYDLSVDMLDVHAVSTLMLNNSISLFCMLLFL